MKEYYEKTKRSIVKTLNSNLKVGLSNVEVENRLEKFGENVIDFSERKGIFKLFLEQLLNPIVIMLLATVFIAGFTGETFEAILILGIVVFMAIIGVYLENKSGNAVEKLKSLTTLFTTVLRDGKVSKVETSKLVPGDIVLLNEGDKVPADCRIVEANELKVDEAILTGESLPVSKSSKVVKGTASLGDQENMLFNGTYIIQGNTKGIVVKTGLETELGSIAESLAEIDSQETPLQKQLDKLSKILLWGTVIVCALILVITVFRGQSMVEALVQALSLAIAFIPEGLSAVMTVTLAIGVKEMVKKKVIIKRLLAAEGLGSVSILATDKTGTITEGKMKVEKVWLANEEINIEKFKVTSSTEQRLIDVVRFCNNSKGATELALVTFLEKVGFEFEMAERLIEHRFSSAFKRMMVIKDGENGRSGYSKGAPDILIPMCSAYLDKETDKEVRLTKKEKQEFLSKVDYYARLGYRVLCVAYRSFSKKEKYGKRKSDEQKLVFVGLICLMDPVRREVKGTVMKLQSSGIRPIMITGDHQAIAETIAIDAGIINKKDRGKKVITGTELEEYFKGKGKIRKEDVLSASVFARVDPDHKNKLVDLFHDEGFLAAMAGDGVNDAVAISKADIGIAVGNGADIVKEAADVIVTGTYDALGNAVEVGRTIIHRTRLYLHYILSGNVCEVGVFILALLFNKPLPLTAISLLIINLLTDAAPAMSMAFEKGEADLMKQKPRPTNEGMINKPIWISIGIQGLLTSIFLYLVFIFTLDKGLVFAQTATFTAYIFQKLLRAFTARSFTRSVFKYGFFSNKLTLLSVAFALLVWFGVVFVVPGVFEMEKIGIGVLIQLFLAALMFPVIEEGMKLFRKYRISLS